MNGSTSPHPPTTEAGQVQHGGRAAAVNGHRRSSNATDSAERKPHSSPPRTRRGTTNGSPTIGEPRTRFETVMANGIDDGADSEAETLIDSPAKKKEMDKQSPPAKIERPPKHRIGSLPVPTDNDDDDSAALSPAPSTVMSVEKPSTEERKDVDMDRRDAGSEKDDDSDELSSPRSNDSDLPSRGSSPERAESERPGFSHTGPQSPNPRKRKHRASSVSIPNKRPSLDAPKRRLRGLHSEELGLTAEGSLSPKLRSHRRAVSTQSALIDGSSETTGRKRRAGTQGPPRELKPTRATWEESDASSETTSHGPRDGRRPRKGIGRSTSTPGRPPGREHKRYVNKYGFTKLAEGCDSGDLDVVKEWREKDPDQLELAEYAQNKPLQIASLKGHVDIVDYLISQGCQIDCANRDKDTPLIDAAENGHLDVVHSLLKAGVDPLRQNLKGQQALDVVNDDTDDAEEIRDALRKAIEEWTSDGAKQRREEEEEMRHRAGPTKEIDLMSRDQHNLLKLVVHNDRNGVREFLDSRVSVNNDVIAAAAKTGDSYLVNMLLVEMPESEKRRPKKAALPLLAVLGTSHFEMVRFFTELDNFDPHFRDRKGFTWPEIAEQRRGPNWKREKEFLQELYDRWSATKERRSSSPVTKRDSGKRRHTSRAVEDESDEDEVPRRKNGRKLMSKREMRAQRGEAASDELSDDSSSELATGPETGEESSMKPPESPVSKRTPTRARTNSFSAQPSEQSPRTRRRSSSLRGPSEPPLPTLDENMEDKEAAEKQRSEDVRQAAEEAEEARKLEDRQREEEAAAAARAAEEARKIEEERQAAEAHRAEEERKAEEARQAEEARRLEEARLAEEERRRKELELAEARRFHRERILACLPDSLSYVLNPTSKFNYLDGIQAARYLVYRFAPLQAIKYEPQKSPSLVSQASEGTFWVINVQAAPLLGEQGIELLIRNDIAGFSSSLADRWDTRDVPADEVPVIDAILGNIPIEQPEPQRDAHGRSILTIDEENHRAAGRLNAYTDAKQRIRNGEAVLRYVRLDDVLRNLHPILRQVPIDVRFDYLDSSMPAPMGTMKNDDGFVHMLAHLWGSKPRPRRYINGMAQPLEMSSTNGTTRVDIVHEK